ncbi:MAG: zinc ribbon domain-containing protein [Spirochaetaceae bacterium]|jgi:predicted  nucleic acid-binding Zn-ribbon protein|nr:zinc ribbon domain-containing protein [Spirochaetaceae bacterium]
MVMLEVFDKLKMLQDILAEKYSVEAEIAAAPRLLSSQDELLARLKKGYIEKHDVYEKVRKTVGELKTSLFEAESSREKAEKGMDTITTHREYEALDKEIKDATDQEQGARKDLQKEEKHLAELDEELKQEEQLIAQQEAELNEGKQKLSEQISLLEERFKNLTEQEQEIIPGIDPEIIFKFERIIKSKQGVGIVPIKGNVCDGCHMILPAQFANEVHTGEKIVFCPYCSRILYYLEVEGGVETDFFHDDDAGSLADLDDFDDEDEDDEDEDDEDMEDSGKGMDYDDE